VKPITHAQKELMLEYFALLERELRRVVNRNAGGAIDSASVEELEARIAARLAALAARVPGASAPSRQQIRKNLEAVLDPAFFGQGEPSDPLRAVRALREQLGWQKAYTRAEYAPRSPGRRPKTGRRG
jgi:hypothetical protein